MPQSPQLTIYIRKVDKKGYKVKLPKDLTLTSMRFYKKILSDEEFMKFMREGQQQKENAKNAVSSQNLKNRFAERIEFYYGGNLMNDKDDRNELKLRDLSIVHVVIKSPQKDMANEPDKEKVSKQKESMKNGQLLQFKVQSNKKITNKVQNSKPIKNQTLFSERQKSPQILPSLQAQPSNSQQLTLSLKLITSLKNPLHQSGIPTPNSPQPVLQSVKVNPLASIEHTLNKIDVWKLIEGQVAISCEYGKLLGFRAKIVYLGRTVDLDFGEIAAKRTKRLNLFGGMGSKDEKIRWKKLNVQNNSQVVVLITPNIQITAKLQSSKSQQFVLAKQEASQSRSSLFQQLQKKLPIRLYEQYKKWEREWRYFSVKKQPQQKQLPKTFQTLSIHNQQQRQTSEGNFSNIISLNSSSFKQFSIDNNGRSKQRDSRQRDSSKSSQSINHTHISSNKTISYEFDPFKQQYQFYEKLRAQYEKRQQTQTLEQVYSCQTMQKNNTRSYMDVELQYSQFSQGNNAMEIQSLRDQKSMIGVNRKEGLKKAENAKEKVGNGNSTHKPILIF